MQVMMGVDGQRGHNGSEGKTVGAIERGRDETRRLVNFDPALLGLGLLLAWSTCMPWAKSHVVGYANALPNLSVVIHAALLVGLAVVCNRRHASLYSPRVLLVGGGASLLVPLLASVGRAVGATTAGAGPVASLGGIVLSGAVSLCEGVGLSVLYLLWSEQYARRPQRVAWPAYAASFAIDPLAYLVLTALPAALAWVVIVCLPIASCLALWRCADEKRVTFAEGEVVSQPWRFPWRPAALMALFSCTYYMLLHLFGGASRTGQLGSLLVAAILLVACLVLFDRFDLRTLYKLCPPLMVCALLSLTQASPALAKAGTLIAATGFTGFSLFMAFILNSICFRYGVHAGWLFGIVEGCSVFAHAVGSFVGRLVVASETAAPGLTGLVLDVAVVAIVLVSMALLSERDLSTSWGIRPAHDDAGQQNPEGSEGPAGAADDLGWRCAKVARHFGLTHREEEVLALLAQGKGATEIETALFISHNTAKGHLRHVYAKLGVHSREEATQIIQGWR